MSSQPAGNRIDTAIKLILVFFIALLSFSVGIFVGKSVSDAEYREAALERGDFQKFRKSKNSIYEANSTSQEKSDPAQEEITDEEIARLTEEFVNDIENEAKEEVNRETASVSEETTKKEEQPETPKAQDNMASQKMEPSKEKAEQPLTKTKLSKESLRLMKDKAPGKDPIKGSLPQKKFPAVETSSVGKYTIQLASYLKESDAQEHATKLKRQGYSAFYVTAKVNKKTWYRVSVGLFSNLESAQKFKKKLKKQTRAPAAIVQKITR